MAKITISVIKADVGSVGVTKAEELRKHSRLEWKRYTKADRSIAP